MTTSQTPLIDLSPRLFVAVQRAQEVLAKWIVPDSGIDDATALNDLLGILDNSELVRAMRECEEQIAHDAEIDEKAVADRFAH